MTGPADAVPGDELPGTTARLTRADLAAYAAASGDPNPIHLDEAAARAAGLPGVVAHGMLTLALAGRVVTAWAGSDFALTALRTRFPRPVVVPADGAVEVRFDARVTGRDQTGVLTVQLDVTSDGDPVLVQARAVVTPLDPAGPG